MAEEIKEKQSFLKQSIIHEGFSSEKFLEFIEQKKQDGDVNSLRYQQLET